jgi:phenylpropionate dioxygenase-like ring-hydroxylating dioxygenase large terminal subunit
MAPDDPSDFIAALARAYRPGGPLQRDFYCHPGVLAADMERIWRRYWLYAGHSCMVPKPGDWLSWQVGHDSVIVVRTASGDIKAFHNTCRHRGSQLCRSERGNAPAFTCPYHGWTYDLDGRLKTRTEKEFGVPESQLGLHPVALRNVAGLLFVALGEDPVDFSAAEADIASRLRHHGLDDAKVAKTVTYRVKANWKIVFENNRECYHCPSAHPEYIKSAFDVLRAIPSQAARVERQTALANERFARLGIDTGDQWSNLSGRFWRANRTPLMEGWVTQSLDGQAVAPLMGLFRARGERSAGTLRTTVFPNFWQHASDDHAVASRITPVGPTECRIDTHWLVHEDAVEGKDYALEALLPFWDRTNLQDWAICEANQAGILSPRYQPGPLAKTLESNVQSFIDWYLGEVTGKPPLRAVSGA